jgi:Flp pilus assembly secretin CpaC
MAAFVMRNSQHIRRSRTALSHALAGLVMIAMAERAALAQDAVPSPGQRVLVTLDQAQVLRMPERTATLVVGNPLIADVSVQAGGLMVVTGKSYGTTNLIALDRSGGMLMNAALQVEASRDQIVFLHRGVDRESYSCTPDCERRVMLGDTPAYFSAVLGQTGTFTSQAQGGAAPAPQK